MKKYYSYLAVFISCLFILACGSEQELIQDLTESTDASSITLRQIDEEGSARVEIPIAVFGETEEDLTGAFVDITYNGEILVDDLNPQDYYVELVDLISFELSPVSAGSSISFDVVTALGGEVSYEGVFSSEENTTAPLIVSEELETEENEQDSSSVEPIVII